MEVFRSTIDAFGISESPIIHHVVLAMCTVAMSGNLGSYAPQNIFRPIQESHINQHCPVDVKSTDLFTWVYDTMVSFYIGNETETAYETVHDTVPDTPPDSFTDGMIEPYVSKSKFVIMISYSVCLLTAVLVCVPSLLYYPYYMALHFLAAFIWHVCMSVCLVVNIENLFGSQVAMVTTMHSCAACLYIILQSLTHNTLIRATISWPLAKFVVVASVCIYAYFWMHVGPISSDALTFYVLHVVGVLLASITRTVCWGMSLTFGRLIY